MTTLRLVLGDQLTRDVAALRDLGDGDVVLMCEVMGEATYVRHHKQKIAFLFSAMRHFAADLAAEGVRVDYVALEDEGNTGTLEGEVVRARDRHGATRVVLTEAGEWRVMEMMRGLGEKLGLPVEIRADTRFFATHGDFLAWAHGRRELRMEFFYREMRRRNRILMEGDAPLGGRWNFDAENRKRLPKGIEVPPPPTFEIDATTRAVLDLVARRFGDHFGDLEPFRWPVTRAGALEALDDFVEHRLAGFGAGQDAMVAGEDMLFHAVISPMLNAGLLVPREVCARVEAAYHDGGVPIAAAEGFIRQVLGWREYVRGIYWREMPDYPARNTLGATRKLPWFYWSGETEMRCMAEAIGSTKRNAYAHHIQRLMVTGNFALIAGLSPAEVEEWYLVVYADAYEWVELPNVHGMILYADGGLLGSKPYAASGAYIDRMSDYCGKCHYDVKAKAGPGACPFNYLYWNFLIENEERLARNIRMAMPYHTLSTMAPERRRQVVADARAFLDALE